MEKLIKEILEQDIELVKVVENFILDRLEQYRDDPDLILGIKKLGQLSRPIDVELISTRAELFDAVYDTHRLIDELRVEIHRLENEIGELKNSLKNNAT